jgi:hypothetical protein
MDRTVGSGRVRHHGDATGCSRAVVKRGVD